jgi:hypothetical protein
MIIIFLDGSLSKRDQDILGQPFVLNAPHPKNGGKIIVRSLVNTGPGTRMKYFFTSTGDTLYLPVMWFDDVIGAPPEDLLNLVPVIYNFFFFVTDKVYC